MVFGENLIEKELSPIAALGKKIVCIYDASLQKPSFQHHDSLFLPVVANERCKERGVKDEIEDVLIANTCTSDTVIVAVGGGSVLDLAGFVAQTFCRGVPLCFFPTTLLAMVDAAIGGKNGLNLCGMKNYIGTIYHPHYVFVDFSYLQTLSESEFQNGLVEMFKIAHIYSSEMVQEFDKTLLQQKESASFQDTVYKSIQMKIAIVQKSQQDKKIRDLLNFGHTVGHALESLENFQMPHGRAVALGMLTEGYLSMLLGHFPLSEFEAMQKMLLLIMPGLCVAKRFPIKHWLEILSFDKKNTNNAIYCVLLSKRGEPLVQKSTEVSPDALTSAIEWLQENF